MPSDPRPAPVDWKQMLEMVEGARARGWPDEKVEYLRAVVGICWTKAYRQGCADTESGK